MVAVVQLVRASDCGSECRRFESDQPPQEIREQQCFLILFLYVVNQLFTTLEQGVSAIFIDTNSSVISSTSNVSNIQVNSICLRNV